MNHNVCRHGQLHDNQTRLKSFELNFILTNNKSQIDCYLSVACNLGKAPSVCQWCGCFQLLVCYLHLGLCQLFNPCVADHHFIRCISSGIFPGGTRSCLFNACKCEMTEDKPFQHLVKVKSKDMKSIGTWNVEKHLWNCEAQLFMNGFWRMTMMMSVTCLLASFLACFLPSFLPSFLPLLTSFTYFASFLPSFTYLLYLLTYLTTPCWGFSGPLKQTTEMTLTV